MDSIPKNFAKHAFDACEPLKALIELTTRCNYRCGHCYNFNRHNPTYKGDKGLSTEEVLALISELAKLGVVELTFSGGEPLLRPDIAQLIAHSYSLHLITLLKTNGSLLDAELLAELAETGLSEVEITIYGFSAESHDAFTGVKGSFEATLQAIEEFGSYSSELKVFVTAAVLAHNHQELHLQPDLEKRLGQKIRANAVCHGRNDLDQSSKAHAPDLDTLVKLRPVSQAELATFKNTPSGDASTFRCGCARISCAIMATGDVVPCVEAPWVAGNIRDASIYDIWHSSEVFKSIRNLKSEDWKTCHGCSLTQVCERRNCSAYKYDAVYTDPDPANGELTYERFKPFGAVKPACLELLEID